MYSNSSKTLLYIEPIKKYRSLASTPKHSDFIGMSYDFYFFFILSFLADSNV